MIESGRRRPSPKVLALLAAQLGTTEDYLLTGRDPGIETKLQVEVERQRLLIHQGRALETLDHLDGIIHSAKVSELVPVMAAAWEVKGAAYQKLGRFEEGLECYDKAAQLRVLSPIEAQVRARCGRARCLFLTGDVNYAVHVLEVLLSELRQRPAPDPTSLAQVNSALVGPYFKSGFQDKARHAADEAHRLAPKVSDPEIIGCMHINLAGVYLGDGLIAEAMTVLARAEYCFAQLDWFDEVATICIARAMSLIDKGELLEARTDLLRGLQTLRKMPDPTTKAMALNQLGRVERMTGNLDEAEICLTEARSLVLDGNLNERGLALRELALCAIDRGDVEKARTQLLSAIDCFRAASNSIQVGLTYKLLGDIEGQQGDANASTRFYLEGLEATTSSSSGA